MQRVLLLFVFIITFSAQAQAQPQANNQSAWTIDDIVMSQSVSNFQVSPDGKWVVWTKNTPDAEKGERIDNLILSGLAEKREIQLTHGSDKCSKLHWSPNGQLIAFLTNRPNSKTKPEKSSDEDSKMQIWLINPFGGEAWPLTSLERGVKDFQWADSEHIVYSAQEDATFYETTIKEKKDDTIVVEDEPHEPPVRLFNISIESKQINRLTNNNDRIQFFSLSPNGQFAFAVHDRSLRFIYDNNIKPINIIWDLTNGHQKQILDDTKFNILQGRWAFDNNGLYIANSTTTDPQYVIAGIIELFYYDLAKDKVEKVDLGWERGITAGADELGCFTVTKNGVIVLLADGVKKKLARYNQEGSKWRQEFLSSEHSENILAFETSPDDKVIVYDYSTAQKPTQLYTANITTGHLEASRKLTELNPSFAEKKIARVETVHWKGALGEEVEGLLYYPHNYKVGKKYPLIVMIHGGPMIADFDEWWETWSNPKNLLCQYDVFVFKPNYHGSSDYGLKWVESIAKGKYYDLEVPDIEKGVDALIERGLADPDKLGVMGWSNGAILTIALTVATTRYKVASVVAGDVEHTSDWATSEFGAAFDQFYFGKSPLEDPQLYFQKSPFYQMAKVKTPTLIFFGAEDKSVSPQQGWMHYRALQQLGNTDVRLIFFPGEGHGPEKLIHQQRKLQEEINWFNKYLLHLATPTNEAFKADSPLASALKLKAVHQENHLYGLKVNEVLIPETVTIEGLEIGRFEVTRAQYKEFDKSYQVEPSKGNYPANNISFAQAKKYCEWLSNLTGRIYRIGTLEEMYSIYELAAKEENTLDYWAGYALNPEDAKALEEKILQLGSNAPLLKEVGSFSGGGEDKSIFDLGGNVAEWAISQNSSIVLGGCASLPNDSKTITQPKPEYIGFRVVKGKPVSNSCYETIK